ncbi:MAG: hypothetical protein ACI4EN_00865 [Butyrivibrio sp.]
MKKRIFIILGAVILIAFPAVLYFSINIMGKNMSDGTYYVTDCEEFPEAYIVVKNGTLQFYNIDLNKIYREEQFNSIYDMQSNENLQFDTGYNREELWEMSDLNKMYVDNFYTYDEDRISKDGTFSYIYNCKTTGNLFGLFLKYDSWNKTIKINNYQMQILFKK